MHDFTYVRDCPAGSYCPAGTGSAIPGCPIGTFSIQQNLKSSNECTTCTGGSYCATTGLTAPTGTSDRFCIFLLTLLQLYARPATIVLAVRLWLQAAVV